MAEPVTMAEIDNARARANEAIEVRRDCPNDAPCGVCVLLVERTEARVLELLRRWWAQGCREVPAGGPVPEGPPYVVGSEPIDCCCCPGLERRLRKLEVPRG